MRRPAFFMPRYAARLSCALTLGLMVGACSHLPPSVGGTKPANPPAASLPAPPPLRPPVAEMAPPPAAPPPAPVPPPVNRSATAAVLVPLTGSQAAVGTALFNAAQLAMFEIADDTFTLLPFDTKGTPEGAVAAAQAAMAQHADIVIGPLFAAEAKAAAVITRQNGVNMVSFTSDRTAVGDGVFTLGFLPGPQAVQVLDYARSQNRLRVAVLAPSNEYGRRVVEWLSNTPRIAPMITSLQYYDPAAPDFTGPIKRLIKSDARNPGDVGFDALLLPDEGARLRGIASMLSSQGINPAQVKLLGTMLWEDAKPNTEPALSGSWYAAPAIAGHADFDLRYTRAFGSHPSRIASLGYDATALAAVLARRSPRDFTTAVLTNPLGFAGVDGLFRLLADGTSERGYAIDEVVPGAPAREIAPAPASFSAAY